MGAMGKNSIRLVQLFHPQQRRRIAVVDGASLILIHNVNSIYELALEAIQKRAKISNIIESYLSPASLQYDSIYDGHQDWKLLPSFDHPHNPFACIVSGTGLTHKNSALNRQMMHRSSEDKATDSLVMYQWGVEGGSPSAGMIGTQPEWFYKGTGVSLRAHGESLEIPAFGNDGGEEPEVAGAYVIDSGGNPWRIGFTTGNEFSDHVMEKKNYLYLAPSKLRQCAIGPELVIDMGFDEFDGVVKVVRQGQLLWSSEIKSGEKNMAHSLENLEYHHFKYPGHRVPFQAHIHFYGADAFSFGNGIKLQDGDQMSVQWKSLGRALENPLQVSSEKEKMVKVKSL
jgi:hypothetical protein